MSKKLIGMGVWVLVLAMALACGGTSEAPEEAMIPDEQLTAAAARVTEIVATDVLATAEPTLGVSVLEILSHQSYIVGDWFYIVGEVRNNSDVPMEFVEIVVTLYDNDERVVGMDYTFTALDVVPPGEKSPFETGTDEWAGTTHYNLAVDGSRGELGRQDLVICSHEHYIDGDWLKVRGEVENTGTTEAEFVMLVITLYDAEGNVVGMDFTFTARDTIPPGETSPFESGTDRWEGFDHYEIQVEGG